MKRITRMQHWSFFTLQRGALQARAYEQSPDEGLTAHDLAPHRRHPTPSAYSTTSSATSPSLSHSVNNHSQLPNHQANSDHPHKTQIKYSANQYTTHHGQSRQ